MSIYEMIGEIADDAKVCVVRREGFGIHHLWDGMAKRLKEDWADSVVLWGWNVLETEKTNRGLYLFV